MATSKDYKDFILEQLDLLDNINCKAMMGEYLLYYKYNIHPIKKVSKKETFFNG